MQALRDGRAWIGDHLHESDRRDAIDIRSWSHGGWIGPEALDRIPDERKMLSLLVPKLPQTIHRKAVCLVGSNETFVQQRIVQPRAGPLERQPRAELVE